MDSLFELFARHALQAGSKTAISKRVLGGSFEETSYSRLSKLSRRFARLYAEALPAEAMIPVLSGKSSESIACMLAAIATQRPFCFLNTKYRGPQIAAVLDATSASACIVDAAGLVAVRGAWIEQPRIAQTKWLVIGGVPATGLYAQAADELRKVAEVIAVSDDDPAFEPHITRRSAARESPAGTCLFTSGSTGEPKGVLISKADLMARTAAEIAWFGLTPDDVLLSVLPFSFDVGLNQLLTALAVGCELVLLDSWLPADIVTTVEKRRVTGISGVPAIWLDLINSGVRFDTRGRHASLRYVTISGGSLSKEQLERLPAVVGQAGIFKTYGQTEAFRATSLRPEDFERKLDSVGKAFPGVRIYIVRDDGRLCGPGEIGEVVHTGLGVMMGYLENSRRPAATSKLRTNPFYGSNDPAPVAIFTADLGHLDADGYLYLKGRRDGMLKVMGNRVYPQEVTHQILTISGVRDAVVVGMPRDDGQTVIVAFIAPAQGVELSPGSVRKALNTKLPAFMIPKEIVFVEHIPRTPTGKPDQRRLVDGFSSDRLRSAPASADPAI
jgi:long-chain acyl-CoA synthetase